MLIRTPRDLGAAIRERRKLRGMGQREIAERIGVSRQWVIGIEKGKARAELGLILRLLDSLDIEVRLEHARDDGADDGEPGPDLDRIVDGARERRE